ncbi:MAG TPA: helix-turn-helix transcriptional regulator [Nocardioidaceae bacterium]|nr:helix-turn-helix transcriptional regulator [Nocardioidaceae bacterium]
MVLFRRLLGEVLRTQRMRQGRTLREVSADARVSLGYISEIERGQKEASSELLASICSALDVPLSDILADVSDAMALEEAALEIASPLSSQLGPVGIRPTLRGAQVSVAARPGGVVAAA